MKSVKASTDVDLIPDGEESRFQESKVMAVVLTASDLDIDKDIVEYFSSYTPIPPKTEGEEETYSSSDLDSSFFSLLKEEDDSNNNNNNNNNNNKSRDKRNNMNSEKSQTMAPEVTTSSAAAANSSKQVQTQGKASSEFTFPLSQTIGTSEQDLVDDRFNIITPLQSPKHQSHSNLQRLGGIINTSPTTINMISSFTASESTNLRGACDQCTSSKVKCNISEGDGGCARCLKNGIICQFSPLRKRGPKPWSNSVKAKRRREMRMKEKMTSHS